MCLGLICILDTLWKALVLWLESSLIKIIVYDVFQWSQLISTDYSLADIWSMSDKVFGYKLNLRPFVCLPMLQDGIGIQHS